MGPPGERARRYSLKVARRCKAAKTGADFAGAPAGRRRGPEGSAVPDYAGLTVGPGFVVGYGIDYAEEYRGLRDIRALPAAARRVRRR